MPVLLVTANRQSGLSMVAPKLSKGEPMVVKSLSQDLFQHSDFLQLPLAVVDMDIVMNMNMRVVV